MLQVEAGEVAEHDGILLISDKGFASTPFERQLADQGIERPGTTTRPAPPSPSHCSPTTAEGLRNYSSSV